jgi:outer membrane lipoprotein-sorting protein
VTTGDDLELTSRYSFPHPGPARRRFSWRAVALAVVATITIDAAAAAAQSGVPACPSDSERPDPAALTRRIDQLLTGRSMVGVMTMSIKTPSWSRTLKLKVWTKGKDFALVRVLEGGPRETGMMTLKREKQLWNWLPQAGRVMKLPSGMLGDSWMGSDFTNDDLLRGNSLIDDFTATIRGVENADGKTAWRVVLDPKPTAVIVWGRIELVIDRASCLPLTEHFFDEDGKLARQMSFSDFRQIGWRQFPAKMTVVPAEKGRETSIAYSEIQFDVDVPDDTFSLQRLRQGR